MNLIRINRIVFKKKIAVYKRPELKNYIELTLILMDKKIEF